MESAQLHHRESAVPAVGHDLVGLHVGDVESGVGRADERVSLRVPDGAREMVHSFEGFQRYGNNWVHHAPDDSILTLRDTSLNEIFALEIEAP